MVVKGTGYAALGWRPKGLTKSCKNFPQIGPVETIEVSGGTYCLKHYSRSPCTMLVLFRER